MAISFKRSGPRYDKNFQDRIRHKIADAQVAKRLIDFVNGKVELTPHQVTASLGLLNKIVPNLASQELTITDQVPFAVIPDTITEIADWQKAFTPNKTEH